jgi:hypothetical protein
MVPLIGVQREARHRPPNFSVDDELADGRSSIEPARRVGNGARDRVKDHKERHEERRRQRSGMRQHLARRARRPIAIFLFVKAYRFHCPSVIAGGDDDDESRLCLTYGMGDIHRREHEAPLAQLARRRDRTNEGGSFLPGSGRTVQEHRPTISTNL